MPGVYVCGNDGLNVTPGVEELELVTVKFCEVVASNITGLVRLLIDIVLVLPVPVTVTLLPDAENEVSSHVLFAVTVISLVLVNAVPLRQ